MRLRLFGECAAGASPTEPSDMARARVCLEAGSELVARRQAPAPLLNQSDAGTPSCLVPRRSGAPLQHVGDGRCPAACCRADLVQRDRRGTSSPRRGRPRRQTGSMSGPSGRSVTKRPRCGAWRVSGTFARAVIILRSIATARWIIADARNLLLGPRYPKRDPVVSLYHRHGFKIIGETEIHFVMERVRLFVSADSPARRSPSRMSATFFGRWR